MKTKDQELESNGSQIEGEIHTHGLLDKFVQEDAKDETWRINCERVHRRVLQVEH